MTEDRMDGYVSGVYMCPDPEVEKDIDIITTGGPALETIVLDPTGFQRLEKMLNDVLEHVELLDTRIKRLEVSQKAMDNLPALDSLFSGRKPSIRTAMEKYTCDLNRALMDAEDDVSRLMFIAKALLDAFDLGRGVRIVEQSRGT